MLKSEPWYPVDAGEEFAAWFDDEKGLLTGGREKLNADGVGVAGC